jgi:RNA polymerase sigma-B factor
MAVMEVPIRAAPKPGISLRLRSRPDRSQLGRPRHPRQTSPRTAVSSLTSSRALLYAYHRRGDLEARDRLITQYLPLVWRLARQHAGRGENVEDLVQVGSIGLINAIDRFELERGVDLAAYAIPSIVGEIKRHLRDRVSPIRIPRRLQEVHALLRASAVRLGTSLERPATVAELAREAGVGFDEALQALAAARSQEPLSFAQGSEGDGDGFELKGATERGYTGGEDRAVLAKGFRVLDQREKRLLHLAFFEDMSQSRIAGEVGISQIHVSRLTRRALDKLRAEIGAS